MRVVDLAETGQNIERLRKEAGLSVKDLQIRMGLGSLQSICRWQRGEALPTVDNLVLLAEIFGVEVDEIIIRRALEIRVH